MSEHAGDLLLDPNLMVVLTAPSGTGKTTVASRVLEAEGRLRFSVSHTTRPRRGAEVDGEDYHFVDPATFDEMVEAGAFYEWAHVHKHRYGTSKAEVERLWGEGHDALFDIDPQGGLQVIEAYPGAVTIFMVPPSLAELEARLRGRGTESEEQIQVRLANAREELPVARRYRYVIVNDEVDRSVRAMRSILAAERARTGRLRPLIDTLEAEGSAPAEEGAAPIGGVDP